MSSTLRIVWFLVLGTLQQRAEAQQIGQPAWVVEGNRFRAGFGSEVASAGDVNRDGYMDVIVGAYTWTGDLQDEGGAFVYHGSRAGLSKTPDWMAEGDDDFANFGETVAGAGDVNGDGFDDVIVGAWQGQRASVYLGGEGGLAHGAAWTVRSSDNDYGWSVAGAGDVDADGYDDVIVGAIGFIGDQAFEGKAYLYRGSPAGPERDPSWIVEGNQAYCGFGSCVATAGDVNGDGFDDVIVGARTWNGGQRDEGRAFVYLGSASGLATMADWSVEGNARDAFLGGRVATAGDVNGDGYDDVIVRTGTLNGAYVYLGSSAGLSPAPDWIAGSGGGSWPVSSGDLNGDGYGDVLVGYYLGRGSARAWFGSPSGLATSPGWIARGFQFDSDFAFALAGAGDVNGDGLDDVIVGAYRVRNPSVQEGAAYTYLGSSPARLR